VSGNAGSGGTAGSAADGGTNNPDRASAGSAADVCNPPAPPAAPEEPTASDPAEPAAPGAPVAPEGPAATQPPATGGGEPAANVDRPAAQPIVPGLPGFLPNTGAIAEVIAQAGLAWLAFVIALGLVAAALVPAIARRRR